MAVYVADAHVQRLVSVVKMASVLDCVLPKSSVLLWFSLWAKGLGILPKKCFLFTVGNICLIKRFTSG
jgi:hypothetical protein